jgi:low affinity Fe/Cu permease
VIHRAITLVVAAASHQWAFVLTTLAIGAWWLVDDNFDLLDFASALAIWLSVAILHSSHVKDRAMHAKLDEIIRAEPEADDSLRGIEES